MKFFLIIFGLMISSLFLQIACAEAYTPVAADEISVEIQTLAKEALQNIRGLDADSDRFINHVESQLPNLKAYLSDETLNASTRASDQISIALNFPKYGLILFDRAKWPRVSNIVMRRAIALHEAASLMEIEGTGVYFLSSAYLASTGMTVAQLQEALRGVAATKPVATGASCEWLGDRAHLMFELWSQYIEGCAFNGGNRVVQLPILENQLRESLELAQTNCRGDQKLYSVTSKMQTLIGTLKAHAPAHCKH